MRGPAPRGAPALRGAPPIPSVQPARIPPPPAAPPAPLMRAPAGPRGPPTRGFGIRSPGRLLTRGPMPPRMSLTGKFLRYFN